MNDLLDTHCHLGGFPQPLETLARARTRGVCTVAVTETPDEYRRLKSALGRRDEVVVAIGMHPARAPEVRVQIARFRRLAVDAGWIGEVGLDYSSDLKHTAATQRTVFEAVLSDASARSVPMTVHSRRAELDTVTMLEAAGVPAILHWWSGPDRLIDRALAAGAYFSVNFAMLNSRRRRRMIASLPKDRVLIETDGPFVKRAGEPSEPGDAVLIAAGLANVWSCNEGEVADVLDTNLATLRVNIKASGRSTLF